MEYRTYQLTNKYKPLGHGRNNIYVLKGKQEKNNISTFSEYRLITVQWLIEVQGALDIDTSTLYVCIKLMDAYIARNMRTELPTFFKCASNKRKKINMVHNQLTMGTVHLCTLSNLQCIERYVQQFQFTPTVY